MGPTRGQPGVKLGQPAPPYLGRHMQSHLLLLGQLQLAAAALGLELELLPDDARHQLHLRVWPGMTKCVNKLTKSKDVVTVSTDSPCCDSLIG